MDAIVLAIMQILSASETKANRKIMNKAYDFRDKYNRILDKESTEATQIVESLLSLLNSIQHTQANAQAIKKLKQQYAQAVNRQAEANLNKEKFENKISQASADAMKYADVFSKESWVGNGSGNDHYKTASEAAENEFEKEMNKYVQENKLDEKL